MGSRRVSRGAGCVVVSPEKRVKANFLPRICLFVVLCRAPRTLKHRACCIPHHVGMVKAVIARTLRAGIRLLVRSRLRVRMLSAGRGARSPPQPITCPTYVWFTSNLHQARTPSPTAKASPESDNRTVDELSNPSIGELEGVGSLVIHVPPSLPTYYLLVDTT
ncbi:hypothetical protein LX36DRAFT_14683 [Colletotrichum falcatum]|nr:hypothetical protein LX36DRAFT_14683 [Colletotrichum falcatum]